MADSAAAVKTADIRSAALANNGALHYRAMVSETAPACDWLAAATGLSKGRIKDAMTKGAVWHKRQGQKERRIRKATLQLLPGDRIELYYDPSVLALIPPPPRLIFEAKQYSVWYKPANLLTQGTRFGDHCSLIRCVEIFFKPHKEIRPVHRLDREAFGLVIVAHTGQGASALSELFRRGAIEKRYRAEVHGRMGSPQESITLSYPLDGKAATTIVTVTEYAPKKDSSTVDILLQTGRFHQIRRHLSREGHPIVGDPAYGVRGTKADSPLQLCAYSLRFTCPFTGAKQAFSL
ncbi:MAG: RluA family pseudouridine synthase [Desulfocapsaceae bacterium]|nr:RluA family pseudouridine synthase [Desulfocapsaceae bacterium]